MPPPRRRSPIGETRSSNSGSATASNTARADALLGGRRSKRLTYQGLVSGGKRHADNSLEAHAALDGLI